MSDVYPMRFKKHLAQKVLKRGIEFSLNDLVENIPAEGTVGVKTQSDKELSKADLVVRVRMISRVCFYYGPGQIPSYGSTPHTAVVSTLGPDVLNQRGFVKVTTKKD